MESKKSNKKSSKKYVVKMFDRYFLRDIGEKIEEIYDLEQATVFPNEKEAQDVIDSFSMAEYCKICDYNNLIKAHLKWKRNGMVRRVLDKFRKKYDRPYKNDGFANWLEWNLFVHENGGVVSQENYKTWPCANKFFDHIFNICFYTVEDNKKHAVSFSIYVHPKDGNFLKFQKELNRIVPHVTYKNKDGFLIFEIFDHELSYKETRFLLYNPKENKHKVVGRFSDYLEGTLEECFEYIKKNFYGLF